MKKFWVFRVVIEETGLWLCMYNKWRVWEHGRGELEDWQFLLLPLPLPDRLVCQTGLFHSWIEDRLRTGVEGVRREDDLSIWVYITEGKKVGRGVWSMERSPSGLSTVRYRRKAFFWQSFLYSHWVLVTLYLYEVWILFWWYLWVDWEAKIFILFSNYSEISLPYFIIILPISSWMIFIWSSSIKSC